MTPEGKRSLSQIKRVHETIWQDAPALGVDES
jgi:hypothetical protein